MGSGVGTSTLHSLVNKSYQIQSVNANGMIVYTASPLAYEKWCVKVVGAAADAAIVAVVLYLLYKVVLPSIRSVLDCS